MCHFVSVKLTNLEWATLQVEYSPFALNSVMNTEMENDWPLYVYVALKNENRYLERDTISILAHFFFQISDKLLLPNPPLNESIKIWRK